MDSKKSNKKGVVVQPKQMANPSTPKPILKKRKAEEDDEDKSNSKQSDQIVQVNKNQKQNKGTTGVQNKTPEKSAQVNGKQISKKQKTIQSPKSKPHPKVTKLDDEEEEEEEEKTQENGKEEFNNGKIVKKQSIEEAFSNTEITSVDSFDALDINERTKDSLRERGYTKMREIQQKSIPYALAGRDVLGKAKTGSGKTLAFLIPAIETLLKKKFTPKMGTGVIIISPTRELSLQTFEVAHEILKYHTITHGVIIGGANRRAEADKLIKGVNVVICTPGRLLDHLESTKGFNFKNLECLIIDETDRILGIGFEEDMHKILKILPQKRQTMLFSATQTDKVEELARLSLKKDVVLVGVNDENLTENATPADLEQGYVVCSSEWRFLLLYTFLKKNIKKKTIVFFSSCKSVKFHSELLNYIDLPVLDLHGQQKQNKRTSTFFEFKNASSGILLCTDVAARGLDIPAVDWIIQFDPPDDPKEYIHRVGRTARGTAGKALLFLLPHELAFLQYLKQARVPLNEYDFPQNKIANVQTQLEKLVEKNYFLHKSAREAYRAYICAYASHSHKQIFDVHCLDLVKVSKGFGFSAPPKISLSLMDAGRKVKRGYGPTKDIRAQIEKSKRKGKGNFDDENPYGRTDGEDKRQFSR